MESRADFFLIFASSWYVFFRGANLFNINFGCNFRVDEWHKQNIYDDNILMCVSIWKANL